MDQKLANAAAAIKEIPVAYAALRACILTNVPQLKKAFEADKLKSHFKLPSDPSAVQPESEIQKATESAYASLLQVLDLGRISPLFLFLHAPQLLEKV